MVLDDGSITERCFPKCELHRGMLVPFYERTSCEVPSLGVTLSYGLSCCGYDIRIAENCTIYPGEFRLASAYEYFRMPPDVMGIVHDKSTLARLGLTVQNTVIEPGWEGFLTLELKNELERPEPTAWDRLRVWKPLPRGKPLVIKQETPIAQVIFHKLIKPAMYPYEGKYQYQAPGPQAAR